MSLDDGKLEAMTELWDTMSDSTTLYIPTIYSEQVSKDVILVLHLKDSQKKLIRAFLDKNEVIKYADADKIGYMPISYSKICTTLHYLYNKLSYTGKPVELILSSYDREGTLYSVDTLWQSVNN